MTARLVATWFGTGHLPKAPGTWGSLAAIPLVWLLHMAGGFWLVLPATLVVTAIGWWATARYLAETGRADPPEVVVDEVAGMMVALWPLSLGLTHAGTEAHVFPWPGWVLGFLLFRAFDILKPGPIGWADRQGGAFGVMTDDLLAGLATAVLAAFAAGVAHGWF